MYMSTTTSCKLQSFISNVKVENEYCVKIEVDMKMFNDVNSVEEKIHAFKISTL